jgi:hypothetical protein
LTAEQQPYLQPSDVVILCQAITDIALVATFALHRLAWDNGLLCGCIATLIFSFSSLQVKLTGAAPTAMTRLVMHKHA